MVLALVVIYGGILVYISNKYKYRGIAVSLGILVIVYTVLVQVGKLDTIRYNRSILLDECIDSNIENMSFGEARRDKYVQQRIMEEVNKYLDSKEENRNYYMYDTVSIQVGDEEKATGLGRLFSMTPDRPDVEIDIGSNTGIIEINGAYFKEQIDDRTRFVTVGDYTLEDIPDSNLSLYRTGDKVDIVIAYDKDAYSRSQDGIIRKYRVLKVDYRLEER